MKKKNFKKRLVLSKKTIVKLNNNQLNDIIGGSEVCLTKVEGPKIDEPTGITDSELGRPCIIR